MVKQAGTDYGSHALSSKLLRAIESPTPMSKFYASAKYMSRKNEPGSLDFTLGDAHEMPEPAFVEALQRAIVPQTQGWYGYKANLPNSRAVVAEALLKHRGLSFDPDDIFLTNGTAVGLNICLQLLVEEGDEVIINLPPWLGYRRLIEMSGATSVGIPVTDTFGLNNDAISAAITEKTRAIIINTPHNPTGKVFSATTLSQLAQILTDASKLYGQPIYLISDETFCRLVFDRRVCPSPTQFYPFSFLVYGYSKTTMAPGQRIGYIALPSNMPERKRIGELISLLASSSFGWCFPSALMQYALADLEKIAPPIEVLQSKRDWMVKALQDMGYAVQSPEGTFFLLVKSPWEDDCAFAELLAKHGVFVLPGTPQEIPGYFRVSLTANKEMISLALPKFQAAMNDSQSF